MEKRKLNYRFHNPNTVEQTNDHILPIFIKANAKKAEEAIRKAASQELSNHVSDPATAAGICTTILLPQKTADIY